MRSSSIVGEVFNRLTVVSRDLERSGYYIVSCECGKTRSVQKRPLVIGSQKSCGCLRKERMTGSKINVTHGLTGTRIHRIHAQMVARCTNPENEAFSSYGGRGVTVAPEWLDLSTFADWASHNGYSDDLSLDRIDNDGDYKPTNCRWATAAQQSQNRRSTKLTWDDVRAIRARVASGEIQTVVARDHDVSRSLVSQIVRGLVWAE